MDRIEAMKAFVRVVEAGSFTKAADTLDVANAKITRLIQGLEEDLKMRLLHRTTRSVSVTAEGAVYYERVVRLLADLEDIESSTRQALGRPSGKVRVETAAAIATSVLIPRLHEFYRQYPDVGVEFSIGTKHADLVADGIDCAIRAGEPSEQSMVARRIGRFQFVTCAAPPLLERHGTPQLPQDIAKLPTIGMVAARGTRPLPFWFATPGGDEQEFVFDHALVVNDVNAYVKAGVVGLGVIQAPSYAVQEALETSRLVRLLDDGQAINRPLHVMYAPNRHLSAKVRVFIDWAVTLFPPGDQPAASQAG